LVSPSAIHEAGHATVALAIGWSVAAIELPNAFDGCTDTSPPPGRDRDWREHVLVLLGGGVSEELFVGGEWRGTANAEEELAEASDERRRWLGDSAGVVELTRLKAETRSLLSQRAALVRAIAEGAVRQRGLTEQEIKTIVETVVLGNG